MNEAETRAEHIDPALTAAGWGVIEGSAVRPRVSYHRGRLQGGGVPVKPHTEGVAQAKSYAGKLAIRHS